MGSSSRGQFRDARNERGALNDVLLTVAHPQCADPNPSGTTFGGCAAWGEAAVFVHLPTFPRFINNPEPMPADAPRNHSMMLAAEHADVLYHQIIDGNEIEGATCG